ncbi:MAG: Crp/Fnr family transcriptional regulator [Anaerolineales bacterium]|nr:Crp/Fnr family transcriptional regulator [Anaerolineales bacterium]
MMNLENLVTTPIELFQQIHGLEREHLLQRASQREYGRGDFIALAGERWPYLCLVEEGQINLVKTSTEGRMLGAAKISVGELFISPTIIDDWGLPASLSLSTPTSVYLWHRDDVLRGIKNNPEAMWAMCAWFVRRMRQASGYIEEMAFQPVASRLARLILEGSQGVDRPLMRRDMTLNEIATMIGTTGVMVCKLLHRFSEEGILEVTRADLNITDERALRELAGVDSLGS